MTYPLSVTSLITILFLNIIIIVVAIVAFSSDSTNYPTDTVKVAVIVLPLVFTAASTYIMATSKKEEGIK